MIPVSTEKSSTKRCSRCDQHKPLEAFHKAAKSKDGHAHYCKGCKSEYGRQRWNAGPEARDKAYLNSLKGRYGLTPEAYADLLERQRGKCAICRCDPNVRYAQQGVAMRRLHVDHWHDDTTAVRGLLCHNCNFGVGRWLDDPQLLKAAIRYLDKHIPLRIEEAG
jgi:hypothetical protein